MTEQPDQRFHSIMEISAAEWLAALRMPADDIPDVVIVEGSWWRAARTAWRLSHLEDVRELAFPDIFWGRWQDRKVVYCCAYGAPRTVEIIHLFGLLGARLAVQIGTCGGLQPHLRTGDIILPTTALCREGVAHYYGAPERADAAPEWVARAQAWLVQRGHTTYTGLHLTWSSLFAQDARLVEGWHKAGYLAVDMETATTLAVSRYFGMAALSMLVVWDDLTRGRSFLDPLSDVELQRLETGNRDVYAAALALAEQLPAHAASA